MGYFLSASTVQHALLAPPPSQEIVCHVFMTCELYLIQDHTPELELAEGRLTKYQIMEVVGVSYLIAEGNHHQMMVASRALGSFGMPGACLNSPSSWTLC